MRPLRVQPVGEVDKPELALRQVAALVADGIQLPKALNAVASPFSDYPTWSPLWGALYDAQEAPKHTLGEYADAHSKVEVLALVDRAVKASA
jgi:hypothetical protein